MRLSLVTAPTQEPVSLDELKAHMRVEIDDDDMEIAALGRSAREMVEAQTGLKLITQTWKLYLDDFPGDAIRIPIVPVASVTHVKYYNSANTLTTWSSGEWESDAASSTERPTRVAPKHGYSWPSAYDRFNAVEVQCIVGYGDPADVPQALRHAIMIIAATWYEHREDLSPGVEVFQVPLPAASARLIAPFKVWQ